MRYKYLKTVMFDRFSDMVYDRFVSSVLSMYIIVGIAVAFSLPVTEIFCGIVLFLILEYAFEVINTIAKNARDDNELG